MVEDPEIDLPDRHRFHYLREPAGSFVLVSPRDAVSTAIVFVHGFNGDALGTWARFELLIDDHPTLKQAYADADLFFLQYNSVWHSINTSVDLFDRFVHDVVMAPNTRAFEVDIGAVVPAGAGGDDETASLEDGNPLEIVPHIVTAVPAPRNYHRLTVVAHSEGGVVVRQAIADCYPNRKNSPLFDARLALFAPALFGYAPTGLLGAIANFPGLGSVVDAFLKVSPAYRDLQPGSKTDMLAPLKTKTESLQEVAIGFRAWILWGTEEGIVKDGKYERDDRTYAEGQNHNGVCKPRVHYDDPLDFVADRMVDE